MRKLILLLLLFALLDNAYADGVCIAGGKHGISCTDGGPACGTYATAVECAGKYQQTERETCNDCEWDETKSNWIGRTLYKNYDWEQCFNDVDCNSKYICKEISDCASGVCVNDVQYRSGGYGVCGQGFEPSPSPDADLVKSVKMPQFCKEETLAEGISASGGLQSIDSRRHEYVGDTSTEYYAISHYNPFLIDASLDDTGQYRYNNKAYIRCDVVSDTNDDACSSGPDNTIDNPPRSVEKCTYHSVDSYNQLCTSTAVGDNCYSLRWGVTAKDGDTATYTLNCNSNYVENCGSNYCQSGTCAEGCLLKDDFTAQGAFLKTIPVADNTFWDQYRDDGSKGYWNRFRMFFYDGTGIGGGGDDIFVEKNREYKIDFETGNNYCLFSNSCTYESGWNVQYSNELVHNNEPSCICADGKCAAGACTDALLTEPRGVAYNLKEAADSCAAGVGWNGKKVDAVISSVKFSDDEGNYCKLANCQKKLRSQSVVEDRIVSDWKTDYVFFDVGVDAMFVDNENGDFWKGKGDLNEITNRCYWKTSAIDGVDFDLAAADRLIDCSNALKGDDTDYLALLPKPVLDVADPTPGYLENCPSGWERPATGYVCSKTVDYGGESKTHIMFGWFILDLGSVKTMDEISIRAKASGTLGKDESELVIYASNDAMSWGNPIAVFAIDTTSETLLTSFYDVTARYLLLGSSYANAGRLSDTKFPESDVWIDEFKYKQKYNTADFELADEFLCEFDDNKPTLDDGIDMDFVTMNDCPIYDANDQVRMTVSLKNTGEVELKKPGMYIWFGNEADATGFEDNCSGNPWCYFGRTNAHESMYVNTGKTAVYWFPAFAEANFMPNYQCEKVYESGAWDNILSAGEEMRVSCWVDAEKFSPNYHLYLVDADYDIGADGKDSRNTATIIGLGTGNKRKMINNKDRFAEMHSLGDNNKVERKNGAGSMTGSYLNLKPYFNDKKIENVGFKYDNVALENGIKYWSDLTKTSCWIMENNLYYTCKDDARTGIKTGTFSGRTSVSTNKIRATTELLYEVRWKGKGDGILTLNGESFAISAPVDAPMQFRNSVNGPIYLKVPADRWVDVSIEDTSDSTQLSIQSLQFKYSWVSMQGNVVNEYFDKEGASFSNSGANNNLKQLDECADCMACTFMDTKDKFVHRWLYKDKPVNTKDITQYSELPDDWTYSKWAGLVFVNQPVHEIDGHKPSEIYLELNSSNYFVTDVKVYGIAQRGDILTYSTNYVPDVETPTGNERIYYANNSEVSGSSKNCKTNGVAGDTCNTGPSISATALSALDAEVAGTFTAQGADYYCNEDNTCASTFTWRNIEPGNYYISWSGAVDTTNKNTGSGKLTIGADSKIFAKEISGDHALFEAVAVGADGILTATVEDNSGPVQGDPVCKEFRCGDNTPTGSCTKTTSCDLIFPDTYCKCEYSLLSGSDMSFSGLKLQKYGTVSLLLEGLQPNKKQFNKGWYAVEFTAVTDSRKSEASLDGRFWYNDGTNDFYSAPIDERFSPTTSIFSSPEDTFGSVSQYNRFEMPLYLPDIYEGYDIGCFVADKYTSTFTDVFYRAFIYKLKFKTFYNMLVDEFSDYTVPIKIRTYDQPSTNWDQPTARLSALNSIGTIKETNPDLSDTIGCISKAVGPFSSPPNKLSYSITDVVSGKYSVSILGADGKSCLTTGEKNIAETATIPGGPCPKTDLTVEICVYGEQAEVKADYVEISLGNSVLHREDFEGQTVIDRVIGGSCPNNYCDYTLGETALTCSDCYGICEKNGYSSATYDCPANIPVAKNTPGCYEVKATIGESCTADCHCGTIQGDVGVCNSRNKCAPFEYSSDIYNEAKQKCRSIPTDADCANYGRKVQKDSRIHYWCLDKTTFASVELCNVAG